MVAEKPAGNKPATGIEVSRESVNGRLVAVRYEVVVSRSRLGELNAWRKKQSSQALSVARASQAAPLGLSSRLRARGIVPRKRAENAVSQPETLKLLVDPGRLDGLRVELGRLQGPAAAAPAENSAKKKPTPEVSSSRGRRSVNSLPGIRPGAKKKAAGSKARTPEKAAAAKVRVEIRFRIVSD